MSDIKAAFAYFDKDGSGKLSASAFKDLMTKTGADGFSDQEFDDLMGKVDLDGDGFIDFGEYLAWLESPTPTMSGVIVSVRGSTLSVDGFDFRVADMAVDGPHQYSHNAPKFQVPDTVFEKIKASAAEKEGKIFFVSETATVNGMCMALVIAQFAASVVEREGKPAWDEMQSNCRLIALCATESTPRFLHGGPCGGYNSTLSIATGVFANSANSVFQNHEEEEFTKFESAHLPTIFADIADYLQTSAAAIADADAGSSWEGATCFGGRTVIEFINGFVCDCSDAFRTRSHVHWYVGEGLDEHEFFTAQKVCDVLLERAAESDGLSYEPVDEGDMKPPCGAGANFPVFASRQCTQARVFYGTGEAQAFCESLDSKNHIEVLPAGTKTGDWGTAQESRCFFVVDANFKERDFDADVVAAITGLREETNWVVPMMVIVLNSRAGDEVETQPDDRLKRCRLLAVLLEYTDSCLLVEDNEQVRVFRSCFLFVS